ncbi:unnamed protein product, partial [Rotaria magnacalcarata]
EIGCKHIRQNSHTSLSLDKFVIQVGAEDKWTK